MSRSALNARCVRRELEAIRHRGARAKVKGSIDVLIISLKRLAFDSGGAGSTATAGRQCMIDRDALLNYPHSPMHSAPVLRECGLN